MKIEVIVQGKNDPPRLQKYIRGNVGILDQTHVDTMLFCVCEGGMASGEPSVIIGSPGPEGIVFLQTSLDKLITGTSGCAAAAESQWGWTRPEGHVTLMPPDRETRKALLQSLIKELEEWDDVEKN